MKDGYPEEHYPETRFCPNCYEKQFLKYGTWYHWGTGLEECIEDDDTEDTPA